MTSELTMLRDRLDDINKALTLKGAVVEHEGHTIDESVCITIARTVQEAVAEVDEAISLYENGSGKVPQTGYPAPAETALP